jgi:phospholipid:diacylglycerol acyltransferase
LISDQDLDLGQDLYEYPHFCIDTKINYPEKNITRGIYYSDGDATVPLISLGWMHAHGWRDDKVLNPSSIPMIVKEYKHDPAAISKLSRSRSVDHVDILGNFDMIMDLLRVVSNETTEQFDRDSIYSDILSYSLSTTRPLNE